MKKGVKKSTAASAVVAAKKAKRSAANGANLSSDLLERTETTADSKALLRSLGEHIDTRHVGDAMDYDEEGEDADQVLGEKMRMEAQMAIGNEQRLVAASLDVAAIATVAARTASRQPVEMKKHFIGHNRNAVTAVAAHDGAVFYGDKTGAVTVYNEATKKKTVLHPVCDDAVLTIAISDTRNAVQAAGLERTTADTSTTSFIAVGSADTLIRVWRRDNLEFVGELKLHRGPVTSVCFRMDTNTLYSVSEDKAIRVWSISEMLSVDKFFGHTAPILSVSALKRERCATGGDDRCLRFWKVDMATQTSYQEHDLPIELVCMLDEATVVGAHRDGTLLLFDTMKRTPLWALPFAHGDSFAGDGTGLEKEAPRQPAVAGAPNAYLGNAITAMAALPYSDVVATGSCDGYVRLWRYTGFATGRSAVAAAPRELSLLAKVPAHGFVNGLTFSADGKTLYIATAKEPRRGRWVVQGRAYNGIQKVPLTLTGASGLTVTDEVEFDDGEDEDAEASSDDDDDADINAIVSSSKVAVAKIEQPKKAAAKKAAAAGPQKAGKRANKGAGKVAKAEPAPTAGKKTAEAPERRKDGAAPKKKKMQGKK
jgi:ribosomal RNA-processing protein 9